ncbi:hypothetical protein [Salinarimonas soli]|uniref:Uncharacterized protein n=1 Tax=Salinarimonas soli TaxID=1638099 RepID=A0A5B2VEE0_9HYPH|nr:hypothetical protein [Salinarimonas soli]KAA2236729.1 hypothetical protein F0L46_13250 [Salinarimonas soli]
MSGFAPVLLAAAAPGLAALTGLTQRSLLGTSLEPYAFGFFLDRYPLFALAIIYGVARLLAVAATEPGRLRWLRLATAPLAVAALLAVCLYPTFGGFVTRAGFFSGGMSFVRGQTVAGGYMVGTAMAALLYGAVLGLGVWLVRLRVRPSRRAVLRGGLSFLALWWAALVIAAPRALGLDVTGDWPALPVTAAAALKCAGLALVALMPHALLAERRAVNLSSRDLPTHREGQTIPVNRAG